VLGYDYHPAAEAEYQAAIDYYDGIDRELGVKFVSQVEAAIRRAREFPELYGQVAEGLRHVTTRRFPYVIVYEVLENRIFIWAIAHGSRRPGYWKWRL
jgi:toxin ParE1/3/4